ncbi:hypothetical protein HA41_12190 [Pantoea conspicua]|uniref:Uncharacterized protein n=1 Tax=Pantoea conspicua TaxID=472705 RepID=A0A1X1BV58_9GAMM|nr:hypothetical protein HA41_12190 [Pantoea conspicua]
MVRLLLFPGVFTLAAKGRTEQITPERKAETATAVRDARVGTLLIAGLVVQDRNYRQKKAPITGLFID